MHDEDEILKFIIWGLKSILCSSQIYILTDLLFEYDYFLFDRLLLYSHTIVVFP